MADLSVRKYRYTFYIKHLSIISYLKYFNNYLLLNNLVFCAGKYCKNRTTCFCRRVYFFVKKSNARQMHSKYEHVYRTDAHWTVRDKTIIYLR